MRLVLAVSFFLATTFALAGWSWAGSADYCDGFAREAAFRKIGESGTAPGSIGGPAAQVSPDNERWRSAYRINLDDCLRLYGTRPATVAEETASQEPETKSQRPHKAKIAAKRVSRKQAPHPKKHITVAKKKKAAPVPAAEPSDTAGTAQPVSDTTKRRGFAPRARTSAPAAKPEPEHCTNLVCWLKRSRPHPAASP
ncbi:MAG: hypothetical protein ACJ8AS_09915 [Hyphomicrobiales bacterium]